MNLTNFVRFCCFSDRVKLSFYMLISSMLDMILIIMAMVDALSIRIIVASF